MSRAPAKQRGLTPVRWLYPNEPRRCDTGAIGGTGECLHCNAESGVACRAKGQSGQGVDDGVQTGCGA
jgi:hypothetical protein